MNKVFLLLFNIVFIFETTMIAIIGADLFPNPKHLVFLAAFIVFWFILIAVNIPSELMRKDEKSS